MPLIRPLIDPDLCLRWPKQSHFRLEPTFKNKLAVFFSTMFNKPVAVIKGILPEEVTRWGKVRIAHGGDAIRGKRILPSDARDNSFIKVQLLYLILSCWTNPITVPSSHR
jgi:hypothetical protein